jgi:uncharacterized protein involved in type VI secretion and phage assembly
LFDLIEGRTRQKEKRIEGIVLGVVTNNYDKEGLGRVKVKFPWLDDGDESRWARIATLMAGNDSGSFFLPEVGDEVVVAFDHGDLNHPYILGALWSGSRAPPAKNEDGKNNIKILKSRSGHTIYFNDDQEQKKEMLRISSKGGHSILLEDSAGQEKIEIVDSTGRNSIKIDSAQNSIILSCQTSFSIKAKSIELESSESLNIKSGTILTIKGSLVKIN